MDSYNDQAYIWGHSGISVFTEFLNICCCTMLLDSTMSWTLKYSGHVKHQWFGKDNGGGRGRGWEGLNPDSKGRGKLMQRWTEDVEEIFSMEAYEAGTD